ncbi:MAG TPA: hypothetical protein PLK35_01460 [Candidatus Moranbacteria bacterium]|nr:hypothetical protein [Candidatus Moranbacteria bacterium]
MAFLIKKITRGTIISIASLGGIIIALLVKIFLGGSHIDISKISSESMDVINKTISVDAANADAGCDFVPCENLCEVTGVCDTCDGHEGSSSTSDSDY